MALPLPNTYSTRGCMIGICGYGADIEIVSGLGNMKMGNGRPVTKRHVAEEKSVPSPDQDTITMSVEAGRGG